MPNGKDWRFNRETSYVLSKPRGDFGRKRDSNVSKGRSVSIRSRTLPEQVITLINHRRGLLRRFGNAQSKGNSAMVKVYLDLIAKAEIRAGAILDAMAKQGRDFTYLNKANGSFSVGEVTTQSESLSDFLTDEEKSYLRKRLGITD